MEFIIVLGNSNREIMINRVKKAAEYYHYLNKKHYDDGHYEPYPARLIFSGKGKHNSSEAEDIFNLAVSKFYLPKDLCIIENKSNNTQENFTETLKLLIDGGWFKPTMCCGRYIFTVVTSSFHASRSLIIGLNVLSSYGDVKIIHTGEEIPKEIEYGENCAIIDYVKNFMIPTRSANINK